MSEMRNFRDIDARLQEALAELEEDENVIKVLRRQRDEAEEKIDKIANFLWKCLPESRNVTETETKDLGMIALKIHVYIKKLERDNEL